MIYLAEGLAKTGYEVDFLGRFENLEEVFSIITDKFGGDIQIPHKIKEEEDDYRSYYCEESIKLISEFYKDEFDIFSYSKNKL